MKNTDSKEFLNTDTKEVNIHCERKNWKFLPYSDVPKVKLILDSMWDIKRNTDIATRKVCNWKARLNVHGGQQ